MKLQELYQKREELLSKAREMIDNNTEPDGKVSALVATEFEKLERKVDELNKQIENHQPKITDLQPLPQGILGQPYNPSADKPIDYQRRGISGEEYHRDFLNAIRTNFKNPSNYLREAVLSDGGYLLPEEFDSQLVTKLQEANVLREISKVISTLSTHQIAIVETEPAAAWIEEGEEISLSKPKFGRKSLSAYKLAIGSKVSNELLQDSYYDLENALLEIFARAISAAEEEAFLLGTGQNQPLGLLKALEASASSFITSKGSEIGVDDCLALYYTLERPYRRNAVFLASDSAIENLRRLKDMNGRFLWEDSLSEMEPPSLLGRPVYTSPSLPAVSTGNCPLIFGDFADFFVIGDRGEREFKPLRELYALSDQTAFLMIERVDCCCTDICAFRGLRIK